MASILWLCVGNNRDLRSSWNPGSAGSLRRENVATDRLKETDSATVRDNRHLEEKELLDFILIQYYNKNNDAEIISAAYGRISGRKNPLSSHLP